MLTSWNIRFWEYDFHASEWLWLLLFIPLLGWILFKKENSRNGDWKYSGIEQDQHLLNSPWVKPLRRFLLCLNIAAISLLILALAKPYHSYDQDATDEEFKNGIDIILAMDVSVSMLAMDFEPNRLEAAKRVAKEFIDGRRGDRIGLVAYAGEAYTACPATIDHEALKNQIDLIGTEEIEGGTAIGTGLGTAVARLRSDSLPSKVVILLTDGSNNAGEIDPIAAAQLAKAKNVRVYTIGVGSNGLAQTPVITPFGIRYEIAPVEIDELTLTKIAKISNGQYFRATDENSLRSIYAEIERLEKRKFLKRKFAAEPPATPAAFLNWALVLILVSWIIKRRFFRYEL